MQIRRHRFCSQRSHLKALLFLCDLCCSRHRHFESPTINDQRSTIHNLFTFYKKSRCPQLKESRAQPKLCLFLRDLEGTDDTLDTPSSGSSTASNSCCDRYGCKGPPYTRKGESQSHSYKSHIPSLRQKSPSDCNHTFRRESLDGFRCQKRSQYLISRGKKENANCFGEKEPRPKPLLQKDSPYLRCIPSAVAPTR